MSRHLFLRRVWALSRKECYQIVRDPSSILVAFILPVIMLFIYGYALNLDSTKVPVGLLMEDRGLEARRFAESLRGSRYLDIVEVESRSQLEAAITAGKIRGAAVVPLDFSERMGRRGGGAQLQVITDGAEPNTANFVENYLRGAWQGWMAQRAAERGVPQPAGIQLEPRFWYNPAAISRYYLIPGSITIIMTVIGALLTSLVVAREWERGTMEALLAARVTKAELLISKLLPYYVLGVVSLLVCVGVAVFVLGVPFRGSVWMLLAVATFFLFSALGLGLLISTATRNQFNAAQAALNAAFLPAMMLSGFIYEIRSMPKLVQGVTYLIPARYFVTAIQTIFQVGEGGSLVLRDTLFLIASSIFFVGLTARKTRTRLD